MARSGPPCRWPRPAWSGLLLLAMVGSTAALDMTYCSGQNTASQSTLNSDMYQSNGLCQNTCRGYAFAVLQYKNCWCSNYAPGSSTSTSSCDVQCPGYTEWCGNQDLGLFAYFALGPAVSGTQGGSSATASASPTASSGSTSTVPSTASSATTTSSSSASPPPTSATEVLTSLTTVTGQVRTIFITPTSSPSDSSLGRSNPGGHGGGLGTGAVVGIVLGVAIGLGLLIGAAVWWYLRRKHNLQLDGSMTGSSFRGDPNAIPSRQVSQMSSAGLMGRIPRITTSGLTSAGGPKSGDSLAFDRRSLGTDQRLNPYAIYAHEESRHSNLSLQDNQDYSRTLRVANPDR